MENGTVGKRMVAAPYLSRHSKIKWKGYTCSSKVGGVQRLWSVVDGNQVGLKPEGTATKSWFLRLQAYVNWYFYELDHSFQSPLYQKRPLYVYTDLVETQVVGGSETDLLREVTYNGVQDGNKVVKIRTSLRIYDLFP